MKSKKLKQKIELDKDIPPFFKWFYLRILDVYVIPIFTLICFWKWDKKTFREVLILSLLVLLVGMYFFYKGMEFECIRQNGGGLAFYNEHSYSLFSKWFMPECIPHNIFYDEKFNLTNEIKWSLGYVNKS